MLSPILRIGPSLSSPDAPVRVLAGAAAAPCDVASGSAAALAPALAKNLRRLVRISVSPSKPAAPAGGRAGARPARRGNGLTQLRRGGVKNFSSPAGGQAPRDRAFPSTGSRRTARAAPLPSRRRT